jgi:hypothetical protein
MALSSKCELMDRETYQTIEELEQELGLPKGFYFKLSDDDDWSFIIKLHSLLEATTNHVLVNALGDRRLEDVISAMQLGGGKTGKLAFMRALELFSSQHEQVISKLSQLRNSLVHYISNVQFNLEEYAKNLNPNQLNEFVQVFGTVFPDSFIKRYGGPEMTRKEFVRAEPKINIWATVIYCLAFFYTKKQNLAMDIELKELKQKLGEAVGAVLIEQKKE